MVQTDLTNTKVPGIPYVELLWDYTYKYYLKPPSIIIDTESLLMESQEISTNTSTSQITENNTTNLPGILHNKILGGLQLAPIIKIRDTTLLKKQTRKLEDGTVEELDKYEPYNPDPDKDDLSKEIKVKVIEPTNNILPSTRNLKQEDQIKAWRTNELGGEIKVIELDNTSDEVINEGKIPRILVDNRTIDRKFCVGIKLYKTPPNLLQKFKDNKYVLTTISPAIYIYFEVSFSIETDNTPITFSTKSLLLEYQNDGMCRLYDISNEKINNFVNDKINEGSYKKIVEYTLSKLGTPLLNTGIIFKLFAYPEIYDELSYFKVGSFYMYLNKEDSILGKEFDYILFQLVGDSLVVSDLPQKSESGYIQELTNGIKYSLLSKNEIITAAKTRTESNITKAKFNNVQIGSKFASCILQLPYTTYYGFGGISSKSIIPVERFNGQFPKLEFYIGCFDIPYIKTGFTYGNPTKEVYPCYFRVNLTETLDKGSPLFRQVSYGYETISIRPTRPDWFPVKGIHPTSISGDEGITEKSFNLDFYIPSTYAINAESEETAEFSTIQKLVHNLNGLYPVILKIGLMNTNTKELYNDYTLEFHGFASNNTDRIRDKQQGTLSIRVIDRSIVLKDQFVANMPFYDGWGDEGVLIDLLLKSGYINESDISNILRNWSITASPNIRGTTGDYRFAGTDLSLGTKEGPIWDFTLGTKYMNCIERVIEYTGKWFFLDRLGNPCYLHPKVYYLAFVNGDEEKRIFRKKHTFMEEKANWNEEIRGSLSYREDISSSCNLFSRMGATPAWIAGKEGNIEVNPVVSILASRKPATDNELITVIREPANEKESNKKERAYFPYRKMLLYRNVDMNNLDLIAKLVDNEYKRTTYPSATISFSTWGRGDIQPLDLVKVIETKEPKVILNKFYSGNAEGIGYFIVTSIRHTLDVKAKTWNISITGERFYFDEDFYSCVEDFYPQR